MRNRHSSAAILFRYAGAAWTPGKKESQPPMFADRTRPDKISERHIEWAFTVANTLGAEFLGKVYENTPAHELNEGRPHDQAIHRHRS
jgi:hypothetical protein